MPDVGQSVEAESGGVDHGRGDRRITAAIERGAGGSDGARHPVACAVLAHEHDPLRRLLLIVAGGRDEREEIVDPPSVGRIVVAVGIRAVLPPALLERVGVAGAVARMIEDECGIATTFRLAEEVGEDHGMARPEQRRSRDGWVARHLTCDAVGMRPDHDGAIPLPGLHSDHRHPLAPLFKDRAAVFDLALVVERVEAGAHGRSARQFDGDLARRRHAAAEDRRIGRCERGLGPRHARAIRGIEQRPDRNARRVRPCRAEPPLVGRTHAVPLRGRMFGGPHGEVVPR